LYWNALFDQQKVTKADFKSNSDVMGEADDDTSHFSGSDTSNTSSDNEYDIESGIPGESVEEKVEIVEEKVVSVNTDNIIGKGGEDTSSLPDTTKMNEKEEETEEEESEDYSLVLPRRQSPQIETVSNECAICLDTYKPGESVVWSCNKNCPHAFHQDCLLDYWVKVNDNSSPCPMCRQNFLDEDASR
jgi:hypothetical protein